jgi:hypothetical protein
MNNRPSSPVEQTNWLPVRRGVRFPPDQSETSVIVRDARKSATILNESYGGIGITIEIADDVKVQVDDALIVLYYGCPTAGRVQWIQRDQETQKVCLGVRWSS